MTKISVIDVVEYYGLGYVTGSAFRCLVEADGDTKSLAYAAAIRLLHRWIDDPHETAEEFDADERALSWASPQKIVAAFGLKGNIAVAVTYILNAAAFADDEEMEITKAIVALERVEVAA